MVMKGKPGFQLETVERLREWDRDREAASLRELERQRVALEKEAAEVRTAMENAQSVFRQASGPGGDMLGRWAILNTYTRAQSAALEVTRGRIDQLAQAQEKKRAELQDATADLKAITKLRERRADADKRKMISGGFRQIEEDWQLLARRKGDAEEPL
jgi:flagellar biosynthesis chaperone FliJ